MGEKLGENYKAHECISFYKISEKHIKDDNNEKDDDTQKSSLIGQFGHPQDVWIHIIAYRPKLKNALDLLFYKEPNVISTLLPIAQRQIEPKMNVVLGMKNKGKQLDHPLIAWDPIDITKMGTISLLVEALSARQRACITCDIEIIPKTFIFTASSTMMALQAM
ncbi:hypothetical protein ACJX0J_022401, partial [Zea mays]